MSVADALTLIRAARGDAALRQRMAAMPEASAEELAACLPGIAFTEDDLQQAFRIDWGARRARLAKRPPPA